MGPEHTDALVRHQHASAHKLAEELPDDVRNRYSARSLRFATASGSRMRPDVVTAFMDQFGDVIYNNYNATEAGMIATATPADLRAAPDTAGRPADGTELRILDGDHREVGDGRSSCAARRCSTDTPRVPPRNSTKVSWPRGTWDTWTRPAGCSWSVATTR